MALGAGGRGDLAVNFVLAQVVAAVRQVPFGRIGVFVARLDLSPGMTVGAE